MQDNSPPGHLGFPGGFNVDRILSRLRSAKVFGFSAQVKLRDEDAPIFCDIFDLSSLGLGLKPNGKDIEKFRLDTSIERVMIYMGTKEIAGVDHVVVAHVNPNRGIVGLNLNPPSEVEVDLMTQSNRRNTPRLRSKDLFVPTICVPDPLRIGGQLHFRVEDISARGLRVSTSLSNHHLLPGLVFKKGQILLPGLQIFELTFRLIRGYVEDGLLCFGAEFVKPSKELAAGIIQFCVFGAQHEPALVEEFQKELSGDSPLPNWDLVSLASRRFRRGMRFDLMNYPTELRDVLLVRYQSYYAAKKIKPGTNVIEMSDEYDRRAYILVARSSGKIFGTGRMVFCRSLDDRFQFETMFNNMQISTEDRMSSCEISKLGLLPDFHGTDIVIGFFSIFFDICVRNKVKNVYCYSTGNLVHLYKQLGGIVISKSIPHPVLENETLTVLKLSVEGMVSAKNMPIWSWEAVAHDVLEGLIEFGFLGKPPKTITGRIYRGIRNRFWKERLRVRKAFEMTYFYFLKKRRARKRQSRA